MKQYEGNLPVAQGDMLIQRIDDLPDGLEPVKSEDGNFILTHSESGHHHVVKERPGVEYYQPANDNNVAYLVVNNPEPALVEHLRDFDTHEPYSLPAGKYRIRRQIESAPEGFVRVLD